MRSCNKNFKQRIVELDFFKGIAILLVVCGHFVQINWKDALDTHPVYTWIYSFHMPLFFFISGFLIHYTFGNRGLLVGLKKKSLSLLVPYFIWCYVIAPFIFQEAFPSLLYVIADTDKRYWFIYLLFFFSISFYIGQSIKNGLFGCLWGGVFAFSTMGFIQFVFPCELISRGLQFFPFYLLGVFSSEFRLHENSKVYREPILSIAFVLFVVASLKYSQTDLLYVSKICKFLASFCVCYIIMYYIGGHFIPKNNMLIETFIYLGKNSIVIYLTHLFMVRVVPAPIVERSSPYPFWVFVICILFSIIIISACLLLGLIANRFKWINRFVYGRGW